MLYNYDYEAGEGRLLALSILSVQFRGCNLKVQKQADLEFGSAAAAMEGDLTIFHSKVPSN